MRPPPVPPLRIEMAADIEALTTNPFRDIFAGFQRNVLYAAELLRGAWVDMAQQMGVNETGAYIDGIRTNGKITIIEKPYILPPQTEVRPGEPSTGTSIPELRMTVDITNTAKHAHLVEVGHGPFSLPDRINWSAASVKHDPKGRPYIIVPFRHAAFVKPDKRKTGGTSASAMKRMMPEEVYKKAKNLARTVRGGWVNASIVQDGRVQTTTLYQPSMVQRTKPNQRASLSHHAPIGSVRPLSSHPQDIRGRIEIRRGATLQGADAAGNVLINPAWKSSKFHGMRKMGSGKHTQYMTFRKITPHSKGWRIPSVAGKRIAARLAESLSGGRLGELVARRLAARDGGDE